MAKKKTELPSDRLSVMIRGLIDESVGEMLKQAPEINPDDVPLLLTRDVVLFPGIVFPITIGREASRKVVDGAKEHGLEIGIVCQRNAETDNPDVPADVYELGVLAKVVDIIELPDGQVNAIVQTSKRFRILAEGEGKVIPGVPSAAIKPVRDTMARPSDKEFFTLVMTIRETTLNILEKIPGAPSDLAHNIKNNDDPVLTVNLIATRFPAPPSEKIEMLRCDRIKDRAFALLAELSRKEHIAQMMENIRQRTSQRIDDHQRKAFLQEQMEAMREELYGPDNDDPDEMRRRADALQLSDEVKKHITKEIAKLGRLNPNNPDYSVQYGYIDNLLSLPWGKSSELSTDFETARNILNSDHYGLERVKERILEQLAVMMHNPKGRSPIICLVGAPGVGKTSIGESMAAALGRKYTRVALGGMDDESEIRGHRRTYIGALPGRIIEAVKRAGTMNPLMLLDEIDKLGKNHRGDPGAALLEVLDPEQNHRFHDNYIDIDFDLSDVMFVATANTLETVPRPLIDRMEIIEMPGYLPEEKIEIARRHLIPRALKANALEPGSLAFTDEALRLVIDGYTAESGVRQLEKQIASIVRKTVYRLLNDNEKLTEIGADEVRRLLGVERHTRDRYEQPSSPGVATGLAWTAAGGEILFIEALATEAKEGAGTLTLTGNLGDIMKESARIALNRVKANGAPYGLDAATVASRNIHIHVPEGAIPKDGPSAGITIATAIVSALTGRKATRGMAMTGELTLSGKVLPVGGIKEKVLAARRAGAEKIVLPDANRKDVADIKPEMLEGLTFTYVKTLDDVLSIALEK